MKKIKKYNLLLFIPLIILMVISFFCMLQARFVKSSYYNYVYKQMLWFFLGGIILLSFKKVKIKLLFDYSVYFYLLCNLLLLLVLLFGVEVNGAKAWFNLKIFNFQPSEFMKIALSLYLAKITNDFKIKRYSEFRFILKCFLIFIIPSILVFLEPDTGAIIFYFLIMLTCLFLSEIKKRWFVIAFSFITLFLFLFFYLYLYKQDILIKWIGTSFFYRVDRLINFKEGTGMQLNNALITIGNTPLFGNFIKQDLLYVPEFPTDFVFTLTISIFGFVGSLVVLLCYFILHHVLLTIYKNSTHNLYKIFIACFISLFLFQVIQNIGMNIGLLPIMGIPLPFLSYGGSNMIVYFIFLGILLKSYKKNKKTLV